MKPCVRENVLEEIMREEQDYHWRIELPKNNDK